MSYTNNCLNRFGVFLLFSVFQGLRPHPGPNKWRRDRNWDQGPHHFGGPWPGPGPWKIQTTTISLQKNREYIDCPQRAGNRRSLRIGS